jgi:Na+-translocating ferredoxin:NAD+ oxidoreductase RNF subunit RnfB
MVDDCFQRWEYKAKSLAGCEMHKVHVTSASSCSLCTLAGSSTAQAVIVGITA